MSTIPFNTQRCKERLLQEYKTYGNLIIAFDFDNTIFDYHEQGDDYSYLVNLLKECSLLGMTLILFTVSTSELELKSKLIYLNSIGIYPDYVNESPLFKGSTKPYYNLLLDDRAGLESAIEQLNYVLTNI
jgi:hypothetical protein